VQVKTREQVRKELDRKGKSIREWAREHGLSDRTVYEVLAGRKKGRRGDAHRAAVLLGIKDGVI
jgi:gp16 family phage-associated protein